MKSLPVSEDVKAILRKEMLDEKSFCLLEESDLKDIGIPTGPRRLLMKEMELRKKKDELKKKVEL